MKKYLPIILLVLGIFILAGVYFFIIRPSKNSKDEDEKTDALIDVSLIDRPVASLTPTSDGHYLNMRIEKLTIPAKTMDYELLYNLPDGRTQGAPGSILLAGEKVIERKLLLGSESSGKFRYDEGVKDGTLSLRFRNDKGKLVARFTTNFALLSSTKSLKNPDESFLVTLDKAYKGYFVVMETFGIPDETGFEIASGPYGVYYSESTPISGKVDSPSGVVYFHDGSVWKEGGFGSGIFVTK